MSRQCIFCEIATDDPIEFGEKLTCKNITAHLFCLLLSSNLTQEGHDDEGMLGFLPADIKKEVQRAKNMKCYYCSGKGANIGCCHPKCRRAFHLPCATKRECRFEFVDTFRSFCDSHHGIKRPRICHENTDNCSICHDEMGEYKPIGSIQAPCCSRWFHKKCLMAAANSAGYFFKCPLCNDMKKFREELQMRGIFIPDKDAAWEEADNYAHLTERPNTCSAKNCQCPDGRDYEAKKENTRYSFLYCEYCGSQCVHKHCNPSKYVFQCSDCVPASPDVENDDSDGNEADTRESDNAEHELSSENVDRVEIETINLVSSSDCSASVDSVHTDGSDPGKPLVEIIVHTKNVSHSSTSTATSDSITAQIDSDETDDESDDCIRSIGKNRSARIYSSDEEDINSIRTETASESRMLQWGIDAEDTTSTINTTQNSIKNDVSDDEDEIKRVVLSPKKNRLRLISSGSDSDGMENSFRWALKRKGNSIFSESASDDDSSIENKSAIGRPKRHKMSINNNNATTPLHEDNKNKWSRNHLKFS